MRHKERERSPKHVTPSKKRGLPYKAIFSGAGLLATVVATGGLWKAWDFVQNDLAPMVAADLSQSLDRPVKLGRLQSAGLTQFTFGRSSIPPHPYSNGKTGIDRDTATVEEIEVRFNPLQTLLSRTLNLDITLVKPNVYLNQTSDQTWLETQYRPSDEAGMLEIQIDRVNIKKGTVTLDPNQGAARKLVALNGGTTLKNNYRTIDLAFNSRVDSGGQAQLQGRWANQNLSLKAKTKALQVAPWMHFLPELPLQIRSGAVDGDFQVAYTPQKPVAISAKATVINGKTQLSDPKISLGAQSLKTDLRVRYTPNQAPSITGTAKVENADANIPEDLVLKNGRSQVQQARKVKGNIQFREQRVQYDLTGHLTRGGQFRARGLSALDLSESNILLSGNNIPAPIFDQAYALPIQIQSGTVDSNLRIKLRQDQDPDLQGWAKLEDVNASIIQMPQRFYDANGTIRVDGLTADLNQVQARYGKVPLIANGTVDPKRGYDIAVKIPPVSVNPALETLQVNSLPVPLTGEVAVPDLRVSGAIATPVLSGTVQNRGPVVVDRVPFESVSAQFRLDLPQLKITNIQAKPVDGGVVTGQAAYDITPTGLITASLNAVQMPGDAIAQRYGGSPDLTVGPIQAQVKVVGPPTSPKTTADFQAPLALYPTQGSVVIEGETTRLRNIVSQVAEGTVFTNGVIQAGQLSAQIQPRGLVLETFSPDLRGQLDGLLRVSAPIAHASAQTLRAEGDLRFSEGLSLIEEPIDAAIAWNGEKIALREVRAPGFRASGLIGTDLDSPTGPQLTTLNLELAAHRFPLSSLAALAPTDIDLSGSADLTGQVSGTFTAPVLQADLGLNQLSVAQVAFEPRMGGTLAYRPNGIDLEVSGQRDRIQVALASDFLPNRFRIVHDAAVAQGQRQGNTLVASLESFPLKMLNLKPIEGYGPVAGLASGQATANLFTYAAQGELEVKQPSFGGMIGDRLTGEFTYRDQVATLQQMSLRKGQSRYRLNASATLDDDPHFEGDLQVIQGKLSDVLTLTQGTDSPTYAMAKDLSLVSVGQPRALLSLQLQRLAEIQAIIADAEAKQNAAPLTLADLSGEINGGIRFQGSVNRGITGDFDLAGDQIQWGEYQLQTAIAKGDLLQESLRFETLRFASGESLAQYSGTVGLNQQSGKFIISQVPLAPLNRFVELPGSIQGKLNGRGQIGGNVLNPTVTGELSLADAQVNQTPIQEAIATINYTQARLDVNGLARLSSPEPITLSANIPYALPFASVQPTSDQIAVDISVADEGLGLISLVTDQIAWQEGQGKANLKVRGTLLQPQILGTVALQNAVLTTPTLDAPIYDVTGKINLAQNQVKIPQLQGRYGEEGRLQVSGKLPILTDDSASTDQITVALNDLSMNVNPLYEGEVKGQIRVTGTALAPKLGGEIQVQNGKVVLTKVAAAQNGTSLVADETRPEPFPIRFNQLRVQLGDRVKIIQPPVLSFTATGELTINGSLDNPEPAGQIAFDKGLINLFTSRFRIDPKRENVAIFDPRYGVDPYLDVGMQSTVFEVVKGRTSELSDFETVPASSLGSVESVRVYADVDGFTSQLQTNFKEVVTITSIPNRSEGEVIALLSGGVTDAVQEGEAQNAVANVASASLLGNVQDALSGVLGSRFTVSAFPVLLPDVDNEESVLSFGTEVSFDVTDRFSVSALQVLTGATQPPIFSARYQLTDKLRARASVGADGEGVGLFEYRMRF